MDDQNDGLSEEAHATDRNTSEEPGDELRPSQLRVLGELAAGASISRAAREAGVDRTTVHRWIREDFLFRAARNDVQRERRQEIRTRIEALADTAADAVEHALSNGDARLGLAVLKGAGLLGGQLPEIGSGDPAVLREEDAIAKAELVNDRELRSLVTSVFRKGL